MASLLFVVALAGTAGATPPDARAMELLNRAREALANGDFEAARDASVKGLTLAGDYRLYCNLGTALHELRRLEEAVVAFRRCRDAAGADAPEAVSYASKLASGVEAELKLIKREVRVECDVEGAVFFVDRKEDGLHECPATLWLAFGPRRIVGSAPERTSVERVVRISAGDLQTVRLVLPPPLAVLVAEKPLEEPPPEPRVVQPTRPAAPSLWPWVLTGAGLAAAGAGAAFHVQAIGDANEINALRTPHPDYDTQRAPLESDLDTNVTLMATLYGVGAAAAIGGVIWAVLSPGDNASPVVVTPLGAGAAVTFHLP